MRRASFVAALFVAGAFAGCIAADPQPQALDASSIEALLSQPLLQKILKENVRVASYDGVEIDNWVYRPDGEGEFPVLINFSPYWGNLGGDPAEGGDAFSKYLVDYFVPRGYAVVLSSARGTGGSDGCFTIGGPGELEDMRRTVDHFVAAEWSNGLVGAGGKSYDGTMPQGLVVTGHDAVKAIFPVSPISEFYKYNYVNGVPYAITGQAFNTYYVVGVGWGSYSPDGADPPERLVGDLACADNVDVQRAQYETMLTGDYTAYWQQRNYTAMAANVRSDLGVFYVHGYEDWNVKPDHMTPWVDAIRDAGAFVKTWTGQWEHDYPHRDDLNLTLLRFFDHYLKGIDTGLLDEPRAQTQGSDGVWRNEDAWPPARATPRTWFLGDDLQDEPGNGEIAFTDVGLAPPMGTEWIFSGPKLVEPMRYAGSPQVSLRVMHTAPTGTIAVTLYEDDGKKLTPINQGFLDLRHRDGLETSKPVIPGESMLLRFAMYPQDDVIPAGSRLALGVSTKAPLGAPVQVVPVPSGGRTTVALGEDAWITLPLVPLDGVEERQPKDLGCWLC